MTGKLYLIIFFISCVATAYSTQSYFSSSNITYTHQTALNKEGTYGLLWTEDGEDVIFEAHAPSRGWAGLGFSPTGGMGGADMVVFWVDANGTGVISDRFATQNGFPQEDKSQDYKIMAAARNNTHLIAAFSRKKNTCDPDDRPLNDDTVRLIYALNDAIPRDKNHFDKHTARGAISTSLFETSAAADKKPTDNVAYLDLTVDKVAIPANQQTLWWCKIVELPQSNKKKHIIGFEPLIQQETADVVHHAVLYACQGDVKKFLGPGQPCFEANVEALIAFHACRSQFVAVWAVGGKPMYYPSNIGMPIFDEGGYRYMMIEMHYDNANFAAGKVDSSGIRLLTTENLRTIEGGQFEVGLEVGAIFQAIPPGSKDFVTYAYCSSDCTNNIPKEGIKVIGGILHTHLAGRKVRVLQFRNGKQLPNILIDENYDFNYQDYRLKKEPTVILPGDQLVVECVYETMNRNSTVFGGLATTDEMCIAFLDYYPKVFGAFFCHSFTHTYDLFQTVGLNLLPRNPDTPMRTMVLLPDGGNQTLDNEYLYRFPINWTADRIAKLQDVQRSGKQNIMCYQRNLNGTRDANNMTNGDYKAFVQKGYPVVTDALKVQNSCPASNKQTEGSKNNNNPSNRLEPVSILILMMATCAKYML